MNRFALSRDAIKRLDGWSTGAQALVLLDSAHKLGWTRFLVRPRRLAAIVRFTALPQDRVQNVLEALAALGVVELNGDEARLSAPFAEMMTPDGFAMLSEKLAQARLTARLLSKVVESNGAPVLSGDDSLTIARGVTFQPAQVGRDLFRETLESLPEYTAAVRRGRVLDVGCGVASGLLTTAAIFPEIRGLGLELVPAVAAEAVRRAKAQGVDDRVEIRAIDARDFDETAAYDACFWAQPFFSDHARLPTLQAIHRALAPGGVLLEQELESEPEDPAGQAAFAMRRMVFRAQSVPFAPSAECLAAEAASAGFTLVRIASTNLGRMVVLQR
ncbi:SAM-dependent methyltransferase [Micromonospora azadirachtae]|uniref:SAM-dependent methyltransferase n=1 Tax=Micromonospora azadirachtae TaxID=1970735 RepID=A0ABW3A416_9ACTN